MTITYLHQDSQEGGSDNLPLLRNWCKTEVKAGRDPYEQKQVIHCIKVSKSGEWVVLETKTCVALVNMGSDLGTQLAQLHTQLKGEGYALVLVPHKKGKLGFSVGLDEETKVYYKYDGEEEYLWATFKSAPPRKELVLDPALILTPNVSPPYPSKEGESESLSNALAEDIASARKRGRKDT